MKQRIKLRRMLLKIMANGKMVFTIGNHKFWTMPSYQTGIKVQYSMSYISLRMVALFG